MKMKILLLFLWSIPAILWSQNPNFNLLKVDEDLAQKNINFITQDTLGYLYLGTSKNGFLRYDGKEFKVFNEKSGLISNKITTLFFKNDSLLIGTEKGISILKNNQFTNFESNAITKIIYLQNKFYFITKKGIYTFVNSSISALPLPTILKNESLQDIAFDGTHFWLATVKNIFKIDDLVHPKSVIKIADGNFSAMLYHDNKLLVADFNKGLYIYKNKKLTKINSNISINNLKKIDNELWIFLKNDGFELVNANDFSFIKRINKYNSIKTNKVIDAFKDNQNTVWLSTDVGVYQLKSLQQKKPKAPKISFENIEVVYESLDSISINSYQKVLFLKPNQNHISFSFKSVDLANPQSILYRYKLNTNFSPWSKNTTVNFANLEAGNYTFFVQAKKGNEKSTLQKFSFFIEEAFYKKSTFIISLFVGFLVLIVLISFLNIHRLKRKNKVKVEKLELQNHLASLAQKARQLQMNPHFIFNVLNGIKAYGISGETKELSETIAKFATLLRGILNSSKHEEISLQNEIEIIKNYIELEQKIAPLVFTYTIQKSLKNVNDEEILIPPMLLQPFIENAIKHGFTSATKNNKINISFKNNNGFLYCAVQDNGIGIYKNQRQKSTTTHKSLAIEITKERIQNSTKYNQFSIEELKGTNDDILGTKVSFKIPLKTDY